MVGGRLDFYVDDAAGLDVFPQQGVVILQEELKKLLLMAPLNLVIVFDRVRGVRRRARRRSLARQRQGYRQEHHRQDYVLHRTSHFQAIRIVPLSPELYFFAA